MNPQPLQQSTMSRPLSINLPVSGEKYAELLSGDRESGSIHSGFVSLVPGESVGLHSTGENEELVVTLSGRGELCSPGLDPLPMHNGCVMYNPPNTPHDVINTGDEPLRYIYIVAKAKRSTKPRTWK